MDFPNNPADGDLFRIGKQRYIATGGAWSKFDGETAVDAVAGGCDLAKSEFFTIAANGGTITVSVTNPLPSGKYDEFMIELVFSQATNITWPASFKWSKGTPPTFPTSGRTTIGGYTRDGGTRYEMVVITDDSK